jgi:hypothetical protein
MRGVRKDTRECIAHEMVSAISEGGAQLQRWGAVVPLQQTYGVQQAKNADQGIGNKLKFKLKNLNLVSICNWQMSDALPCFCHQWGEQVFSPTGPLFYTPMLYHLMQLVGVTNVQTDGASWFVASGGGGGGGGAPSAASAAGAPDYTDRSRLTADLLSALLAPVSDSVVSALPASSFRPHLPGGGGATSPPCSPRSTSRSRGGGGGGGGGGGPPTAYWRIRDAPAWGSFPGLRAAVASRTRVTDAGGGAERLNAEAVLRLLDSGGVCGATQLRRIHDPAHPLSQYVGGSLVGTFAARAVGAGEALGVYAGVLAPVDALESYLTKLPREAQRAAWSYDIECGIHELTLHGAGVRNALAGINDFHGIDPTALGASVTKVPVRVGGVLPIVVFVARRAVPAGAELTLNYGPAWVRTFVGYFPAAKEFFQNSQDLSTRALMLCFGLSRKDRTRHQMKTTSEDELLRKANEQLRADSEAAQAAAEEAAARAAGGGGGGGGGGEGGGEGGDGGDGAGARRGRPPRRDRSGASVALRAKAAATYAALSEEARRIAETKARAAAVQRGRSGGGAPAAPAAEAVAAASEADAAAGGRGSGRAPRGGRSPPPSLGGVRVPALNLSLLPPPPPPLPPPPAASPFLLPCARLRGELGHYAATHGSVSARLRGELGHYAATHGSDSVSSGSPRRGGGSPGGVGGGGGGGGGGGVAPPPPDAGTPGFAGGGEGARCSSCAQGTHGLLDEWSYFWGAKLCASRAAAAAAAAERALAEREAAAAAARAAAEAEAAQGARRAAVRAKLLGALAATKAAADAAAAEKAVRRAAAAEAAAEKAASRQENWGGKWGNRWAEVETTPEWEAAEELAARQATALQALLKKPMWALIAALPVDERRAVVTQRLLDMGVEVE